MKAVDRRGQLLRLAVDRLTANRQKYTHPGPIDGCEECVLIERILFELGFQL